MTNLEIENLKNEYLEKVKESKSKAGSRNIIIFTINAEDDVINAIKEHREITKKCIEVKNSINIISLTLKSVISEKELVKKYEHFTLL